MKVLATRIEDELYFQGPFWIIADSVDNVHRGNFELLCTKYLSTYFGEYTDNTISKSLRTHRRLWEEQYSVYYPNVTYTYYPRGRVCIHNGKAYIHLNSKCNVPKLIDAIIEAYAINKLDCEVEFNDTYQGSHYEFQLS